MHHWYKLFKPLPLLHLLHWDRCLHNKTVPTSHPLITNKGKPGIIDPRTKETIDRKEAVNNQILPTMSWKTDQPKILHDQMH